MEKAQGSGATRGGESGDVERIKSERVGMWKSRDVGRTEMERF